MLVYIVVTQEPMGGKDKIKVFSNRKNSEQHQIWLTQRYKVDACIIERELLNLSLKVFIVATEELYGGENNVSMFSTGREAVDYIYYIENTLNLKCLYFEKYIE